MNRTISGMRGPFRTLSIALLCTTCLSTFAFAEDIETTLATGVSTSTIADGQPDDITITEDGSIEIDGTDGFVAVTLDSDNSVTNDGTILIDNSDSSVGIRIQPGFTGDVTNNGTIYILEDYTREDEDDDDDADGPFAVGTDRYGILLNSGGTHTGNITTGSSSEMSIEGKNSAGISLQSALDGDLTIDGAVYILGDDSTAIEALEAISGDVLISSSITSQGENAVALDMQGDIGGAFTVESYVYSTGFESTSATNYILPSNVDEDTEAVEDRLDADAILDNTATVIIGGSVDGGILINGAVDDYISEEDSEDETKDTIEDYDENRTTGTIYSYGSGPALLISADADNEADGDLLIGTVVETVRDTTDDDDDDDITETLAVFDYDYGLINRGAIGGYGQNVGFEATAVRIEGEQSGDGQTIIEGGFLNTGTIKAVSYEADATSISIGEGSVLPRLVNDGSITTTTYTQIGNDAAGIDIEAGADLQSILNTGTISTATVGLTANTYGVRDASGSVSEFTNQGIVAVSRNSDGTDTTTTGDLVAIDLSANTSGITFVQEYETPTDDVNEDDVIDENDATQPAITGAILLGSGDDSFTVTAGDITGNINFGTGNSDFTLDDSEIAGNLRFSTGDQQLSIIDASLTGNLIFTNSTGLISISDGSVFDGRLVTTNSAPDLVITGSDVTIAQGTEATLTSLTATGDSLLTFEFDPNNAADSILTVSGDTYIAENVSIAPVLTSLPEVLSSQTLITSGNLVFEGSLDDVDLANIPWLYSTDLAAIDGDVDTLDLVFTRKSSDELGLDANQDAALDSLMDIFTTNSALGSQVVALTTEADFNQFYDLLLPQRTDASTSFIAAGSTAIFQVLDDSLLMLDTYNEAGMRVWAQEYFLNLDADTSAATPGYNGDGFGMALGADRPLGNIDAVGVLLGFSSGDFEEKTGGNNPVTTTAVNAGVYARERLGGVNLRAAGTVSRLNFFSHRDITTPNGTSYDTTGEWNGWSASFNASADSEFDLGPIFIHPQVALDWLSLSQDGYTETGGGGILNANVGSATTDRLTASTLLGIGTTFSYGESDIRAELEGGYRSRLSGTPFATQVSYGGSDSSFYLNADDDDSDALIMGLSIVGGSERTQLNFGYNVEVTDTGTTNYTGASIRFQF